MHDRDPRTGDDRGLGDLMGALARHGIEYWVDSGVLLGLYRSGELLSWEKDIDLGVTSDEVPRLLDARAAFTALGYETAVHRFRGKVFAVALTPCAPRPASDLRAAVHVFYEVGDALWSPQPQMYVPPPAPDVFRGARSRLGRLLRWTMDRWFYTTDDPDDTATRPRASRAPGGRTPVYRAARWAYRRVDRALLAETWPIREVFVPFTWVLPRGLVLPLATFALDGRCLPVPGDVEGYLTFRYGDWRTPVADWCYWEDDGGLVAEHPLAAARRLARRPV